MQEALQQARLAFSQGEVPVGAIIVNPKTGAIISKAYNLVETSYNAIFHAEILAINEACQKLSCKDLSSLDMYVTLEPCAMCASAVSHARLNRLFYGASDPKRGAVENGVRFFTSKSCFHRPEIYADLLSEESSSLLKEFFKKLR